MSDSGKIIRATIWSKIKKKNIQKQYNTKNYEYDEKNMRVVGRHSKRMYTLGDTVKIKVLKADIDRRTIDLAFADHE